jgi:hypothetical protein
MFNGPLISITPVNHQYAISGDKLNLNWASAKLASLPYGSGELLDRIHKIFSGLIMKNHVNPV